MSLVRKAYFIPGSMKIKDLLKDFQKKHTQMAIVTNEIGDVAGVVTMEDILEELVGEIQDEHDNEKPYVEQIGKHRFIITAHRNLSDINRYLPYRLDESEHYETLSGLIAYHFPSEIQEGQVFHIAPYDALILKMYRNSVETLELKLPDEENA
jgi:CBS domain containing-hemolysin-like protein